MNEAEAKARISKWDNMGENSIATITDLKALQIELDRANCRIRKLEEELIKYIGFSE